MDNIFVMALSTLFTIFAGVVLAIILSKRAKKKGGEAEGSSMGAEPEQTVAEISKEKRETAITELNLQARMLGVTEDAGVEDLIDLCVKLHNKLTGMGEGVDVLMTAPNDFMRLLTKHFPEYIVQCAKLEKPISSEDKARIDAVLAQLTVQIEGIITDINNQNYAAFNSKSRFMEIRFSDKY